jgi:uncharacterized membrane protein
MATSTPGGGGQTNLGVAPNVAGLLCYVPCCVGLVFAIVAAIVEKQSRFVRFHAFQSLLLHGAEILFLIALGIAGTVLSAVSGFMGLILFPLQLLMLVVIVGLAILLMIKANAGEEYELPVIGKMARQWV